MGPEEWKKGGVRKEERDDRKKSEGQREGKKGVEEEGSEGQSQFQ